MTPILVILSFLWVVFLIVRLMYLKFSGNWNDKEVLRVDNAGHGDYGASRGNRTHKGVDLLYSAGSLVFAPIDLIVTKLGQVYSSTAKFRYLEFKGRGLLSIYRIRVFYMNQYLDYPAHVGDKMIKGAPIGVSQDIAAYHGNGMLNHIHIEAKILGIRVNPTPFIKFD